jgi:hypothetical protein
MAKTTPKRAKVKPIRADQPPIDEPDGSDPANPDGEVVPEQDPPPPQAAGSADQPRRGRPPGPQDPTQRSIIPFFKRVAAVDREDWGTRYKIKVYRLAPIIDRLRGSENKYITIYEEPITEERIKHDFGSGRYRLYLSCKSPASKEEKELDRIEFDILDMNFPPKVPPGEWVEDARNKPWAWAKPQMPGAEAAAAATASGNMLEAVEVLAHIQDRAEDRARERADQNRPQSWDPAQQLATVVTAAKDIAGALKATPENPIPSFISEQMAAMRAELAAQRARSDALMDRLLDNAKAPQQQNGPMDTIKQLVAGIKGLLPDLQGLFPKADEAIADRMARSRMSGWQEFFQPSVTKLSEALATIAPFVVQSMASQPSPPQPSGPGAPPVNVPHPLPAPQIVQNPPASSAQPDLDAMLLNALSRNMNGKDFADSLITLFGKQGEELYDKATAAGEQALLMFIQHRPVWAQLGPLQAKLPEFIHEFVSYGEDDGLDDGEPLEPTANANQPPIDLTAEVESGSTAGGVA